MKVFKAYDNQYDTMENAQWIIDSFGNPLEQVKEDDYNENEPLYTIEDGEQVEMDQKNK